MLRSFVVRISLRRGRSMILPVHKRASLSYEGGNQPVDVGPHCSNTKSNARCFGSYPSLGPKSKVLAYRSTASRVPVRVIHRQRETRHWTKLQALPSSVTSKLQACQGRQRRREGFNTPVTRFLLNRLKSTLTPPHSLNSSYLSALNNYPQTGLSRFGHKTLGIRLGKTWDL